MSIFRKSWTRSSLLSCTAGVALTVGICGNAVTAFADDAPIETIVVTDTKFNTDAAPAKASLDTTEPQTIINRSYIQDFVAPQADYVTILAIVPAYPGAIVGCTNVSDSLRDRISVVSLEIFDRWWFRSSRRRSRCFKTSSRPRSQSCVSR